MTPGTNLVHDPLREGACCLAFGWIGAFCWYRIRVSFGVGASVSVSIGVGVSVGRRIASRGNSLSEERLC